MNKQNATEQTNQQSVQLDEWSSLEIIQFMNQEDEKIAKAVNEAVPIIAHAVDAIVERWKMGGRCFVVGAGTSGRLGMVDAVELGPTFSIEQDSWIGLVAAEQVAASSSENKFAYMASEIYAGLGGDSNVASVDNCVTRLRIEVKEMEKVNQQKIKATGVPGINIIGPTSIQVIVGTQVQFVADEIDKIRRQ